MLAQEPGDEHGCAGGRWDPALIIAPVINGVDGLGEVTGSVCRLAMMRI
jgi:hypothetical protein